MTFEPDVIVVGAGLAGLVVTHELARAGRRVLVLDQEGRDNLGGQAWWSLGGLFLVDSPEQRRMGVRDSRELAWADWQGTAGWDRLPDEDDWARRWAEAYVDFAAGEKRAYLHDLGLRLLPLVGWAERGSGTATGPGNSVPRFHLTWGTGPGVVETFARPVLEAEAAGRVRFGFRHRVEALLTSQGAVSGVRASVLADDPVARGASSGRVVTSEVELRAPAVVVASGGIGHDLDQIRSSWPADRLGPAPAHLVAGVPAHVDGRMLGITEAAGGRVVNRDRMWHYTEGLHNWDPVWPMHGIRILPGPSSLWLDATGRRLPAPHFPGFDSLGALAAIGATGYDYSWFVLTQSVIEKEFALSGSEQNPDLTGRDVKLLLRTRLVRGASRPVEAFKAHGVDFVVASTLPELVDGMSALAVTSGRGPALNLDVVRAEVEARDAQIVAGLTKDLQLMAVANARRSRTDRLVRVAKPHRFLDPAHGPLIAVRLNILTRKTLGGLQTDLSGRVLTSAGTPIEGLYAAGEVAGFGGGGLHGYRSLEGTFLGGCIFSGRVVGRALS